MHHALQIHEILLNIFSFLVPSGLSSVARKRVRSNLVGLARTCRTFKGPALDVLWSNLDNPSPLIQCLPDISHIGSCVTYSFEAGGSYLFTRPLERAEWDILRSYARRVWHMLDLRPVTDWKTITASMEFTPGDPLFPNLRSLHCELAKKTIPLLRLYFPRLLRLYISLPFEANHDLHILQDSLNSLAKTSPNIKTLEILGSRWGGPGSKIISDGICGWSDLQTITCPRISLDADALLRLSHMPTLSKLAFMLDATFPDGILSSHSPLFSKLRYLDLYAKSLAPISKLLVWIRLPTIRSFVVNVDNCPLKQDFASFMVGIQIAGMDRTIRVLDLKQEFPSRANALPTRDPHAPLLDFNSLRPSMKFRHLRCLKLDLDWSVNISDNELVTLASAWPRLQKLLINVKWGWNMPGGVTPNGLSLLLETCPFLTSIALAIDTRGCTQLPARGFRENASLSSFKGPFRINVLNSVIENESIDAMAAFLASIVPHFHFILTTWHGWPTSQSVYVDDSWGDSYRESWEFVYNQANEAIKMQWLNVVRELLSGSRS